MKLFTIRDFLLTWGFILMYENYLFNLTKVFFLQDFHFRQMKKARVFEPADDLPKERSSLLTVSNKYGLTFVGFDRTFKVYLTQDVLDADKDEGNSNEVGKGYTF